MQPVKTEYVLSLSYGKDSLACLGAIEHLGWPLDRIVTADVWATDDIPAEYPPVVAFKMTYEKLFYHVRESGKRKGQIVGFPFIGHPECQKALKIGALRKMMKEVNGTEHRVVQYLGIAADEPDRIASQVGKDNIMLPLVELGWEEDLCGLWCKYNGLLSPTYETSTRDGCWFCHNQGVDQLRNLRKTYPELWEILLKWDEDSPVTFKPGRTVHDFDRRFKLEDEGLLKAGDPCFKWSQLNEPIQLSLF